MSHSKSSPVSASQQGFLGLTFTRLNSPQSNKVIRYFMGNLFSQKGNEALKLLLDEKSKNLLLTVDCAKSPEGLPVYIINVIGRNDDFLIKKGKELGLPRGFKVVFVPSNSDDEKIVLHGFFPKFENDPNRQEEVSVPKGAKYMTFFKKFSGFLGLLFTVSVGGKNYWVATSKNSASNEFVGYAQEIFSFFISDELLEQVSCEKLTLSFEVMSKHDQCHGARVLKNACILTCVSKHNSSLQRDRMVGYLSLEDAMKLSLKYSIPCARLFSVPGEYIDFFAATVHNNKDVMTDSLFQRICEELSIRVCSGNVTHEQILGDVLEGIVAHFILEDGSTQIMKIKFINYTVRTMVLRTIVKGRYDCESARKLAENVVPRWTSSENATKFWISFVYECYLQLAKYNFDLESEVASHILVADQVSSRLNGDEDKENSILSGKQPFGCFPSVNFIEIDGKDILSLPDGSYSLSGVPYQKKTIFPGKESVLILIRGLPGSGKTTLARSIADSIRIHCVSADDFFDKLGFEGHKQFIGPAHHYCLSSTERFLKNSESVAVHNTFTTLPEMKKYIEYIPKSGNIGFVILETQGSFGSVHNVPKETLKSMEDRMVPLSKVTKESILSSKSMKKNTPRIVQVRLVFVYAEKQYHITISFSKGQDSEGAILFFTPHIGKEIKFDVGDLFRHDGKDGLLEAIKVHPQFDFEIPEKFSKKDYHITFNNTGVFEKKPVLSNNLLDENDDSLIPTERVNAPTDLPTIGTLVIV